MTAQMRISQIRACVHNTTSIISGIQIKLTDSLTNATALLQPIGSMSDKNSACGNIEIDIRNDFLRNVTIGYNSSGVYGFQFETYLQGTYSVGLKVSSPSLNRQLWWLTLNNKKPIYAFVGFAGWHQPCQIETGQRINALQIIAMDINCTTVLSQQGNYIYKDTCNRIETSTSLSNATTVIQDSPTIKDDVINNQTSTTTETNSTTSDTLEPETNPDTKSVTEPVTETIKVTQIEQQVKKKLPLIPIAAGAGGGILVLISAVVLICVLKRKKQAINIIVKLD